MPEAEAATLEDYDLRRIAASAAGDSVAAAKFYSEDLVYIHAAGKVDTRASLLASFTGGPVRIRALRRNEAHTRLYGDVAVMTGTFTSEVTVHGEDKTLEAYFTAVWRRVGGAWQMVSWQSTAQRK